MIAIQRERRSGGKMPAALLQRKIWAGQGVSTL